MVNSCFAFLLKRQQFIQFAFVFCVKFLKILKNSNSISIFQNSFLKNLKRLTAYSSDKSVQSFRHCSKSESNSMLLVFLKTKEKESSKFTWKILVYADLFWFWFSQLRARQLICWQLFQTLLRNLFNVNKAKLLPGKTGITGFSKVKLWHFSNIPYRAIFWAIYRVWIFEVSWIFR